MAQVFGPAVPLGLDSGLSDFDEEGLFWPFPVDMTVDQSLLWQTMAHCELESPIEHLSPLVEAAKSPGRQSHRNSNTGASSSVSPGTASLIYTPTSTLLDLDFPNDAVFLEDAEESDNIPNSPASNISPTSDDYVHVHSLNSRTGGGRNMSNRPPPVSRSGVAQASSQHSRASSVTPSISVAPSTWGSLNSTTSAGGWMDHQHDGQGGHFVVSNSFAPDDDNLLSGITFDPNVPGAYDFRLPFRATNDGDYSLATDPYSLGSPFTTQALQWQGDGAFQHMIREQQQAPQLAAQQLARSNHDERLPPRLVVAHAAPPSQPDHAHKHNKVAWQAQSRHPTVEPSVSFQVSHPRVPSTGARQTPHPTVPSQGRHFGEFAVTPSHQHLNVPQYPAGVSSRRLQPAVAGASNHAVISSQAERLARKGGRQKNSHLAEGTRRKSHTMRKTGACWRCVLQRDQCPDENLPCGRCSMKSQKGQAYFFDCDRSKLPDFVLDFLPPSMTLMHQKQMIEDCVNDQVVRFDTTNSIDVYLTSAYGPALRWKLYEFQPRTNELLGQYQYLQDKETGQSRRYQKYSPPFGLLKLETSDDTHFESYMDRLLHPQVISDFGWTCFEEETQLHDKFQAALLHLICELYINTTDIDLHDLLRKILRMMIITYIMGHALTIEENTLFGVLDAIRHSPKPTMCQPQTSPKLANRQLKFFFCLMRTKVYEQILNWQQQTFHASTPKKEETWLPSFCAMLAFAMVLEEVQRTIHLQADAKASKGEMGFREANIEAVNACGRIDTRFSLLVGLFQCKYRSRTWGSDGSFGPATPRLSDQHANRFLYQVRELLLEKREHLESRKDVPLAPENQCRYTSRLVARFLLPFLGLPE